MPLRFPTLRPGRRSPGSISSRSRRMGVESLESRELMAVDFTSAMGFGSPALSAGAVAVAPSGNSYVAGFFADSINLNPGPGVTMLYAHGTHDIYLAEYSKAGSLLWAKDIPSSVGGYSQAGGIALDGSGNILLTGTFSGTTNFNPSGSANLTSGGGGTDAFVAKYDPSGNYLWAESLSGSGVDQGSALAVAGDGNVILTGSFTGATTLNTPDGARSPVGGLSGGQSAAFVARFDSSGNLLWADGFNGTSPEYGAHVALDAAGNTYAGGIYQGTITIGATSFGVPAGSSSAFVTKIDRSGHVQWATGFGGSANTTAGGLVVDSAGDVFAAGSFKSTSNFGGIAMPPSGSYTDGYLVKLSPQGGGLWAKQFGGSDNLYVTGLGRDSQGNLYLGGGFFGTIDFNPNSASQGNPAPLTALGGEDVFIQKLDASGNYQWAKQAGGSLNDTVMNLAVAGNDDVLAIGKFAGPAPFSGMVLSSVKSSNLFISRVSTFVLPPPPIGGPITYTTSVGLGSATMDARGVVQDSLGNTFVTGYFRGSPNFDPNGATATTLTSTGQSDIYLAEYSPTGSLIWAKSLGSSSNGSSQANALAMDAAGNLVLTGSFSGTTNFNPNGSATLTAGSGGTDAFVARYDSSGHYLWARSFHGNGPAIGNSLAVDSGGNAVVTGSYSGTTAFGNTTLTGSASAAFVAKLDASGNVLWADGFGGSSSDTGLRVALDAEGNTYAAGNYQGSITIGHEVLSNAGSADVYIAKLSPTGNVVWADGFGSAGTDSLGSLTVDDSGNLEVVGTFASTISFGRFSLTPYGGSDVFVLKLDPTAPNPTSQVRWAEQIGGALPDYGSTVATDSLGNIYVGGEFTGLGNFDPNGVVNYSSNGGLDGFVEKLDPAGNYQWNLPFGGPANDFVTGLAVHGPNDVTVIGRFSGPALLGTNLLQSVDSANVFVSRISVPTSAATAIDFVSAVGVGGNAIDERAIARDSAGNSYVTGFFNGTVNFATGTGVTNLTAAAYHDIYLAKYTSTGALVWARDISGSGFTSSQGNAIQVDTSGNVVISGSFNGTVNFNPGGGGGSVTSGGSSDAFVAKYDGQGNFRWVQGFGGSGADQSASVTTDAAGNIYATGSISDSVKVGTINISNSGTDAVIVKFDPSGSVVWARTFGNNSNAYGTHVAVDGSGNVYATGSYTANVSYTSAAGANRTLPGNGSLPSVFATKLNPDGSIAWADGFTGSGNSSAGSLAVDASGHVFIDGTFRAATNFGGTTLTPTAGSSANGYITKLNSDGSVAWAEQLGATTSSFAFDLATDSAGSVYVGGQFSGTTNFNPGSGGALNLSSISGSQDAYVLKLDTNGRSVWAKTAGGAGTDTFRALAVAAPDDVTMVGLYTPTSFFKAISLSVKTSSTNVFLARIAPH